MNNKDELSDLKDRIDRLEEEIENLNSSESLSDKEDIPSRNKDNFEISRRSFLKMLGIGAGGLAMSSAASGVSWSVLQPGTSGVSDIKSNSAVKGVTNGNSFDIRDTTNGMDLLRAKEGGPVSLPNSNLGISTGNGIEDGSSTERIFLGSNVTDMNYDDGVIAFRAGANAALIRARNGRPFNVYDVEGAFTALKYVTSSSAPGNLKLTNSNLTVTDSCEIRLKGSGVGIKGNGSSNNAALYDVKGNDQLRWENNGGVTIPSTALSVTGTSGKNIGGKSRATSISLNAGSSASSWIQFPMQNYNNVGIKGKQGEVAVSDGAGNITIVS